MSGDKWFYPAQTKITEFLNKKFGEDHRCDLQDVTKNRVYEHYSGWMPGMTNPMELLFVIHKPTKHGRGLIFVYNAFETSMIQYETIK